MSKSKTPAKLSTVQIVFYVMCVIIILSMVFAAFAK